MSLTNGWFKTLFSNDGRKAFRQGRPPLVAYFWDGGQPVAHVVQNISPTGFYLLTKERWLLGTLIMMTLQRTSTDPTMADCSVIVMSKVVRYGDDGVGLAFMPVENPNPGWQSGPGSQPADRKTLDKFLHLVESDPGFALLSYLLLLLMILVAITYGIKGGAVAIALTLMWCAMRNGSAFGVRTGAVAAASRGQVISIDSQNVYDHTWRKNDTTTEP
jgi:hypothetical protein